MTISVTLDVSTDQAAEILDLMNTINRKNEAEADVETAAPASTDEPEDDGLLQAFSPDGPEDNGLLKALEEEEEEEKPAKPKKSARKSKKDAPAGPTPDELRELAVDFAHEHKNGAKLITKILREYGVKKLSELPDENVSDVFNALKDYSEES